MQDYNVWPYVVYPQLVKKELLKESIEYRVVNDSFIFAIIQFIKGYYAKWMSIEVVARITEINMYYIQFKIFTYLRVASTLENPKKSPKISIR